MDPLRKRLLFRARHMGTNENDILFGRFATRYLPSLTDQQLAQFERLLEVSDPDLFLWLTGARPVPAAYDHEVMRLIKEFTATQAAAEGPP